MVCSTFHMPVCYTSGNTNIGMKTIFSILFFFVISLINSFAQAYQKVFLSEHDSCRYYYQVSPKSEPEGLLILLPGARGDAEWPLMTTKIPYLAAESGIVTIMISYEMWLGWLHDDVLELLNESVEDVLQKEKIPRNKCIIGGFSSGGNMALSYAEFAHQDISSTVIVPKGVFALDPPCDLTELYYILHQEIRGYYCLGKKIQVTEETESMHHQMSKYLGTPGENYENFMRYSPFLLSERFNDGGMAIFLIDMPVRIYSGYSGEYFKHKAEGCSLYFPGNPFLISFLRSKGNDEASYIDQYDDDYNPDGGEKFRGRHAWKGFDSVECVDWIVKTLGED